MFKKFWIWLWFAFFVSIFAFSANLAVINWIAAGMALILVFIPGVVIAAETLPIKDLEKKDPMPHMAAVGAVMEAMDTKKEYREPTQRHKIVICVGLAVNLIGNIVILIWRGLS